MKKCQHCQSEYTRMAGVLRAKKDYGYCSIQCVEDSKKPCPQCGTKITRREGEKPYEIIKRNFCSQPCASRYHASQPKSDTTRAKMSHAASNRSTEELKRRGETRKEFEKTPAGKESRRRTIDGFKAWREANPEADQEARQRATDTKREAGVYDAQSERMTNFYQTPEGKAQKEKYSRLYTGKKRPPRVTQKMRQSLREYWDSPAGWKLREEISHERTEGRPDVPYGPGWVQQRIKIRKRDNRACAICGLSEAETNRRHDVHHIHSRRKFGYVPGENTNCLWANHPANLITLCQSCHRRVEMGSLDIPEGRQELADMIWTEFIHD